MTKNYNFIVDKSFHGCRVDLYLSTLIKDLSRNKIISMIDEGGLSINNKKEKRSYKVKENDVINFTYSYVDHSTLKEEDIPLDIVYEDESIAIINKPQGLVVHPGINNYEHTLANGLKKYFHNLSNVNGQFRPGIVHRIDKDTSGLICVAKTDEAHLFLSEQLKNHTMRREYIALVKGNIKEKEGKIDLPIKRSNANKTKMEVNKDGKTAITYFNVLKRFKDYTLVHCKLLTGRTHQIRVHFAYIGHPIDSDPLYNKKNAPKLWDKGQLLHAFKLTLIHPLSHKEMTFQIDLPVYFKKILDALE